MSWIICFSDTKPASLLLSYDNGWYHVTTTVPKPGIIVSHGYPYHYTPGMMWLWEISFDDNTFVGLLFSNVSFNIYKVILLLKSANAQKSVLHGKLEGIHMITVVT